MTARGGEAWRRGDGRRGGVALRRDFFSSRLSRRVDMGAPVIERSMEQKVAEVTAPELSTASLGCVKSVARRQAHTGGPATPPAALLFGRLRMLHVSTIAACFYNCCMFQQLLHVSTSGCLDYCSSNAS